MQRHHCVPLSLWSQHVDANLVELSEQDHKKVHEVMDIPIRQYHALQREFRKKHNGKVRWDKAMFDDILQMQTLFLSRGYLLPNRLREKIETQLYTYACYLINNDTIAGIAWGYCKKQKYQRYVEFYQKAFTIWFNEKAHQL